MQTGANFSSLFNPASPVETILFNVFIVLIVLFLIVDLGLINKKASKISAKSALYQSIFWILISSAFGLLIYLYHKDGLEASLIFFSCYLTEKALSVDNIFVILLILRYFRIDEKYYHKILFWGILGAILFRGVFIFLGIYLITAFHWVLYVFGFFLIYSGFKVYFEKEKDDISIKDNLVLRVCKRYLPVFEGPHHGNFIITKPKLMFTPLFLVIILIETTDIIFAMDSIPAVFAITQNDFLIYTSNIFAVLGLRAMFFLLSGIVDKFYLLKKGLSIILFFIGAKMLVDFFGIQIPIGLSFAIILLTLVASVVFSILFPQKSSSKK